MSIRKHYGGNADRAREAIVEWILATGAEPGSKLPSQAELVKLLNCSETTVHKAMKELAQQGFIRRKVGQGSFLRMAPTPTPAPANPLTTNGALGSNGLTRGHRILVCSIDDETSERLDSPAHEILSKAEGELLAISRQSQVTMKVFRRRNEFESFVRSQAPQGVLLDWRSVSGELRPTFAEEFLKGRGIPAVHALHACFLDFALRHIVTLDNTRIGHLAMEHLIGLGHERVMVVGTKTAYEFQQARIQAAANLAKAHGCPCIVFHPQSIPARANEWRETGRLAFQHYRGLAPEARPTAIFAVNDKIGASFVDAAIADGLRVPDDVSVIGVDNEIGLYFHSGINLTTIEPNRPEVGRCAARWLMDLVRGMGEDDSTSKILRVSPTLIPRESTRRLADILDEPETVAAAEG